MSAESPQPKSRPPQPRRRAGVPLRVSAADAALRPTTFWQELRRQATTSLGGIGVSLGLHVAFLLILATLIHHLREPEIVPELVIGWLNPEAAKPQKREMVPVQIAAIPAGTFAPPPQPNPVEAPERPATSAPGNTRTVAPVAAKRMFDRRRQPLDLSQTGGETATKSLALGLAWMARQQRPDGSWQLDAGNASRGTANYPDAASPGLKTDTGATALALLTFLGVGETHLVGEYKETIRRGLDWLINVQKPNGDLHDWDELGRQTAYYAHAQATIALCEAFALTGDENLREPAQHAVQFLLDSQYVTDGGWKYQQPSGHTIGDLSVTGWALMALHTARAAELDVPADAFERASGFLDTVQEDDGFRYKYMEIDPLENVSPAMTAEGLLCRQWLGWERDHPHMVEGAEYLVDPIFEPRWSEGERNVYQWYYTAQMLHNLGSDAWTAWFDRVQQEIVAHQSTAGSRSKGKDIHGSWHPSRPKGSPWEYGDKAGRLYVTAMCLLILETPLRHAAVYE